MELRQEIMYKAIRLFSEQGYANTTIRDIAEGMDTFSIDISKERIMDAICARYQMLAVDGYPLPEAYKPVLEYGSCEDILNIFFHPLPGAGTLDFQIIRIVLESEAFDADTMNTVLQNLWDPTAEYVREVLSMGVELGRLTLRHEEIETFAHLICATCRYCAGMWTTLPNQTDWGKMKKDMLCFLARLLSFAEYVRPAKLRLTPAQKRELEEMASKPVYFVC